MFRRLAIGIFLFFIAIVFSCKSVFANAFKNDALLDAEATGMATIVVAQADSPSAVQFNPAGIVQLKEDYARVGYTSAIPRNFRTDTTGSNQSSSQVDNFLVPNLYFVNNIGLENWKFGLGVSSPYGLGTDWADDSFARFQTTESSLQFLQINPALAYKYNDMVSFGFGVDYVVSETSSHKRIADGDGGNGESGNGGFGDFHAKGNDDGWGYNLGLLIKPSEKHRIGVAYRSKVRFTYKGTVSLTNMENGRYAGLGFTNNYVTGMESRLTLPQSLSLGYAFKPNKKWTIESDGVWTDWSSVQEDFVKYTDEGDATRLAILNDGNPLAKDWGAVWAYGISAKYDATDKLVLRAGYLYAATPVPAGSFEPSMVDMDMDVISFGAGYKFKNDFTIDAAYFVGLYRDRFITNDVASTTSNLDGTYESYVNVVSVGFTYKY